MTHLPPLTIIPAGAGSGKTYTIQTTLAEWVVSGQVQPDRIVAVTFTEAAAAELRERICAELTAQGRFEDALRLDQAYISTIHAFGLRILTEFAFDCGISPSPRLLNEDEEGVLMRRALAVTDRAEEVMADLAAFGYRYDFTSGKGAEDQFRDTVLKLIAKLRSIGRLVEDPLLLQHAERMILDLYGPTSEPDQLETELHGSISALLERYPHDLSSQFGGNKTAMKELPANYRDLKRGSIRENLSTDWKLWQRLRKLRVTGVPADYKALAEDVMLAADRLPEHPGPREEALRHLRALLGASEEALSRHAGKKREQGLVDYTDMLALSRQLFATNRSVMEMMKKRVDCLIIDEFQDTNPLQFSLLWSFYRMGVPTLIVGDLKQAIMGFQNADFRLLQELQLQNPDHSRPLTGNWRSTPALMEWINSVGAGLFPDSYTPLAPCADYPSTMPPLEAIITSGGNIRERVAETSERVFRLLSSGREIYDRKSRKTRLLQGGDIAVLCPTNARLEVYAEELRALGLKTRIASGGWVESRIVQIACNALSWLADPHDRHAALCLVVSELGSHSLESACRKFIRGEFPPDPLLEKLEPLRAGAQDRTVPAILAEAIAALNLYGMASNWLDGDQVRVNLLRLQQEASDFHVSHSEALASGGYFGSGIKTFLAWLAAQTESPENNGQPEPKVHDEDAIELVTWHRSKGREWPVVVVAALDCKVEPRLPSFDVVYESFADLDTILDNARIELSPDFAAKETSDRFSARLMPDVIEGAVRLLYVALTRARETLILEWRTGNDLSYLSILQDKAAMSLNNEGIMHVAGRSFVCPSCPDYAVAPVDEERTATAPLSYRSRRALIKMPLPVLLTPDSVSPSSLHSAEGSTTHEIREFCYGEASELVPGITGTRRGSLLHRCFEIGEKLHAFTPEKAEELLGYKLDQEQWLAIQSAVADFYQRIGEEFAPIEMITELPILYMNDNGIVVSGVIDLLLETSNGYWIIDHKSDVTDDYIARFASYLPQLQYYTEAVSRARHDKPVLGVGINWIKPRVIFMTV